MICELLKGEIKLIFRSVVRYIDLSVSRAMGCFIGCFRIRHDHRRPRRPIIVSDSTRSLPPEAAGSKHRLSALFLTEEGEDLEWNEKKGDRSESPQINKALVDEAKFLKACGTLPETPSEIRKASEKLRVSRPVGNDSNSSGYHSWLPNTSSKELHLDKPIDELPTPVKHFEEWGHGSVSSEQTPSSCISNVQNSGRLSLSSVEDAANVPFKNKSVRFECNIDTSESKGSSFESGRPLLRKCGSPGDLSVSKPSPKPTPLKLSEDMQTPGTVFPATVEVIANGKIKIRSQYVHPLLDSADNASQVKVLQVDDSRSHQGFSEFNGSLEQPGNATPKSEVAAKENFVQESKMEASLSSLLNRPQCTHKDEEPNDGIASGKKFRFLKTPADRPIIGMVAAHWNENEPTQISPKWWDGNGIPNSTNKYKEDQKVSWHATPFEERLEKALSEETSILQKKPVNGRSIVLEEHVESDTALSKLQGLTESKSVVSF